MNEPAGPQRKLPDDCTRCGICREVCLAEELGGHTITSLLSGGDEYSAWLCSCCWLCQESCPEAVDIHQVIVDERRTGRPSAPYRDGFQNVLRYGYAFSITEETNELRVAYGLEALQLVSQARLRLLLGSVGRERDGSLPDRAGGET